ncbi:arylsulfatase [bacterium]|nr:arylsulfatase [bacterium]
MTDQHRGDCVGADGNPVIHTPHLDRIAREGAIFRRAYSAVPSCTPARAGLLTGLSPWHHGMLGYSRVARRYRNEMPRMLREAGYHTLGLGKMHWAPQRALHGFHKTLLDESGRSETKGFVSDYRRWFREAAPGKDPDATGIGWNDYAARPYALPEALHPTRWMGDQAVQFLQSYDRAEPFFLKVSFARPHSPYDAPQRLFDRYQDADLPKAAVGAWAERYAMRGATLPDNTWRGDLGAEQARRSRQGYYASVTFIDEQIGRILDALETRGEMDNTLILFTADHGDMLGDHNLWRKTYAYEASARIPMLVRWPDGAVDAPRGQSLGQPVELRDVLPTFLDAAGVSADPARFDGRSLLDLARGNTAGWREVIDFEHDACYGDSTSWNALTDGHIKYIYHAQTDEEQLFDLDADPTELHDLASDPAHDATRKAWRQRLVDHFEERGAPYIANGDLTPRPTRTLHSPNYPANDG